MLTRQSRHSIVLTAKQLSRPLVQYTTPATSTPIVMINQSTPVHTNAPVITGVFIALLNNRQALIKIPSRPDLLIATDISAIEKVLTNIWIRDKGRHVTLKIGTKLTNEWDKDKGCHVTVKTTDIKVLSIGPESEPACDVISHEIPSLPKKKYSFTVIKNTKSNQEITRPLKTIYEDEVFFDHGTDDHQLLSNESGYFYEDSKLGTAQLDDLSEEAESLTDELSEDGEYLMHDIIYNNPKRADNSIDEFASSLEENEQSSDFSYDDLCKYLLANIQRTVPLLKDSLVRDYPDFYKQFMLITSEVGFNYRKQVSQLKSLAQKYEEEDAVPVCCFFKSSKARKNDSSTQFITKIRTLDLDNLNMEKIEHIFPTVKSENGISLDS